MSNVNIVVNEAKSKLGSMLKCSGDVLYSSAKTLNQPVIPVYLLGLNPGGNPEDPNHKKSTVEKSLDILPSKINNNYTGQWGNNVGKYGPGKHPLQVNVIYVLECLVGIGKGKTKDVCASNLIFKRSKDQSGVNYKDADICWPIHKKILEIVKPKLIITIGNSKTKSSYMYLRKKLRRNNNNEIIGDTGHTKCSLKSFKSDPVPWSNDGILVIGLPHFSRYPYIIKRPHVIDWIKKQLSPLNI